MLTSEQQKIYNVKVPKGGYGYYTLYHGIYDPENDIDERPSYAQTGDLFEPEGSSVVYKATRKNGKTTWAITEDAQRQSETGEGGSSGSSLPPMTGKNGKVLGVTLDSENKEQAEWVTPPSGGGAEKFVVTLTEDDDTWTADKTIAEIVAADAANQVVVCKVVYAEIAIPPFEIPFSAAVTNVALFGGVTSEGEPKVLVALGMLDGGVTQWTVESVELGSSNAPLIVTLTAGSTEGQFVGDKTYKEVYDAFNDNTVVTVKGDLGEVLIAGSVLFVGLTDSDYTVVFCGGDSNVSAIGTANDYITVTVGG